MTVAGSISYDHMSSISYDLISRWGFSEPLSVRHLRIAQVMKETLLTGYTDPGGDTPSRPLNLNVRSGLVFVG